MRHVKLLAIAIASFVGAILGEGLVRRAIALLLCGVLSFNSTACYGFFSDRANASIKVTTNTQVAINAEFSNSQIEINQVIAQLPRIRQQNPQPEPSPSQNLDNRSNFQNPSSPKLNSSENLSDSQQISTCNLQRAFAKAGISENSPKAERLRNLYYELLGAASKLNNYRQKLLDNSSSFINLFPLAYYNTTVEELRRIQAGEFQYPVEKLEQMQAFFDAYIINRENWDNGLKNKVEPHWAEHFRVSEVNTELHQSCKTNIDATCPPYFTLVKPVLDSGIDAHVGNDLARAIRHSLENSFDPNVSVEQLKQEFKNTEPTLLASGKRTTRDIFPSTIASCGVQIGDASLGVTEKVIALRNAAWDEATCKNSEGKYCNSLKPKPVASKPINHLGKQPELSVSDRERLIKMGEKLCNSSFSFPQLIDKADSIDRCREIGKRVGRLFKGTSYGDPHLITFDGYRYSFQTVGEFVLAKSTDGVFEVQTRQSPVNRSLSLNSAVAMRVGNDRVAFYSKDFPDSDTSTPLRINGKPRVIEDKSLSLSSGGNIHKQNDSNYVVEWATGEKVAVTIYSRGQFKYMDVFPFVFESQANQMVGLLGNVNGKKDDDLRFRSGDILPSKSTYGDVSKLIQGVSSVRLPLGQLEKMYFDKLNKDFGNSWRVSPEESLFDYPSSQSTKSFTDKAFPDAYLTLDMLSPEQLQGARSQCLKAGVDTGLLEGCVFDVGFTGYSEFAARTAQISNILNIVESVIPGFKNPIPDIIRKLPKIPGLKF